MVDGEAKAGLGTPSRKLEFFSPTLYEWGWPEREYTIPWPLKSHVHPDNIDLGKGGNAAAAQLPPAHADPHPQRQR